MVTLFNQRVEFPMFMDRWMDAIKCSGEKEILECFFDYLAIGKQKRLLYHEDKAEH